MIIKSKRLQILLPALIFAMPICGSTQQPAPRKPINLVMPKGAGRIVIPSQVNLQWKSLNLYDHGSRPVFQIENKSNEIAISYVLFPNSTGSASPQICRDDIVNAAIRSLTPAPGLSDVKQIKKSDQASADGKIYAIGSFFVASMAGIKIEQQNIFKVAASQNTCAEVHISKASYKPVDDLAMTAQLESFSFEPDYLPSYQDYVTLGTILYNVTKSFEAAAFYYQRALDSYPAIASIQVKRFITDQLSMSYGISGQLKSSRAVNEAAIKSDPDYPLYYYNLACADAEQHNATAAKIHLQLAFDRKANTLPGEAMPDPTKDDSILKLKQNKEFWSFVQTLK